MSQCDSVTHLFREDVSHPHGGNTFCRESDVLNLRVSALKNSPDHFGQMNEIFGLKFVISDLKTDNGVLLC